jgi:transcriptional regulator with XRE-family HTH domain
MENVHIGNLIRLRLTQLGMTKAEFARRINKSAQNVHDILSRESVDTHLLWNICVVLNYNFFKIFIPGNQVLTELQDKHVVVDKMG